MTPIVTLTARILTPKPSAIPDSDAAETRAKVLARIAADAADTKGSGRLRRKVGMITGVGAEISIGAATARLFARESAEHLYLLDISDQHLSAFAQRLAAEYPHTKITHIVADAADPAAIAALVDRALHEEGHVDFFFANAGIGVVRAPGKHPLRNIKDIEAEEFAEVMRVNALSAFVAIKHAAPAMMTICPDKGKDIPGGSIILTASVAALRSGAAPIPNSASKAAIVSLAQTAALELAGSNVRVNALCPGAIETAMTAPLFAAAKAHGVDEQVKGAIVPMRRHGVAHEQANAALFLASEASSYVNGTALVVDGGVIGPVVVAAPLVG